MRTDCPPTYETIDKVIEEAKRLASPPPKQAVTDVCPICATPIVMRNCEVICESAMCRRLLIESCSGG